MGEGYIYVFVGLGVERSICVFGFYGGLGRFWLLVGGFVWFGLGGYLCMRVVV